MRNLRITTSSGEVVREPDRAALAAVIEAAGRTGRGAFVVLDGDTSGQSPFLQATREAGTAWRVEVWRVAPHSVGERYRTFVADDAAATAAFWSWAVGTDEWQRLRWQVAAEPLLAVAG